MKVTGWTNWDDERYTDIMQRWDSVTEMSVELRKVEDSIAAEIRKRGYKFTGDYHQNGDFGVPIIDDKWIYRSSQRRWGSIMAKAYNIDNKDGYGYLVWAWVKPDSEQYVTPEEGDYDYGRG